MKLSVFFSAGVVVGAVHPLVSFSGVWDLTMETFGLVKDVTLYAHDKALEFVPTETRLKYEEYLNLGAAEFHKAKRELQEIVRPTVDVVHEALTGIYQAADKRTSGILNTIVVDFERRFPRESGKIGRSLLDRLVLILYLYIFFKTATCLGSSLLSTLGCRKRPSAVRNDKFLQTPIVKEFKPPQNRISEVASAPPRPSFPKSKQ
jgi:hypothetical protein